MGKAVKIEPSIIKKPPILVKVGTGVVVCRDGYEALAAAQLEIDRATRIRSIFVDDSIRQAAIDRALTEGVV